MQEIHSIVRVVSNVFNINIKVSDTLLAGDPAIGCNNTTEFDCAGDGKMCVPLEKVCNRKNDCGGWQDEPKGLCYVNECIGDNLVDLSQKLLRKKEKHVVKGHITVVGGGCDQQCIDLPIGYRCACDKGYKLVGNTTCVGKKTHLVISVVLLL